MAATSHKGGISFGLVYIPTALYAATKDDKISFNLHNLFSHEKTSIFVVWLWGLILYRSPPKRLRMNHMVVLRVNMCHCRIRQHNPSQNRAVPIRSPSVRGTELVTQDNVQLSFLTKAVIRKRAM